MPAKANFKASGSQFRDHPSGRPSDRSSNRSYRGSNNRNDHHYDRNAKNTRNYTPKPIPKQIKEFDPPAQITATIRARSVFNIAQELILRKDYAQLLSLVSNIRNVVRSIIRKKCKAQFTIDEPMVRSIESDPSELVFKPEFNLSESTPNPRDKLDSIKWSIIYRSLMPAANVLTYFEGLRIDFNQQPGGFVELSSETFDLFFEIHYNTILSEYAMQRDKLVEEYAAIISNEISKLDQDDPEYDVMCQEITNRYNVEMYKKYDEFKDNSIWKYIDMYRDVLMNKDVESPWLKVEDFKVRMCWACLTFDLFACGVDPLLKDIIDDPKIFYIEFADEYEDSDYIEMMKILYQFFFNRYPNYDNITCTESQYNDWRTINIYRELLLLILEFKHSEQTAVDLIDFDTKRIKLFNTFILEYSKYNPGVAYKYSSINLEKKYGSNRINLGLNKLTKKTFDDVFENLNRLYPREVLTENVVTYGCLHSLTAQLCCEFVSKLGCEELIEHALDEYKHKDDQYWNFKALIWLKGCAYKDLGIEAFLNVNNQNTKAVILNAFVKNYEIGNKISENKELLKVECAKVRDSIKGQMKYIMIDMIEILDRL